jgi:hypothetical protein
MNPATKWPGIGRPPAREIEAGLVEVRGFKEQGETSIRIDRQLTSIKRKNIMASDIVELQQAASTTDVHGNGGGVKGLGSEMNPSEVVGRNFELAAGRLGLSLEQRVLLKTPFRKVREEVPVRVDDGSLAIFAGYRVQHSGARGPAKGGIRYHPSVNESEIRALAEAMTWKTALMAGLMERHEEAVWMLRAVLNGKSASSRELRVSAECRSSENQVER